MSQATPILSLPLIQPSQAQKHVTHNEALLALDALVQPVAIDRDRALPPNDPAEGDSHIVAVGASGLWADQDQALAVFAGGGWVFHAPRQGWRVYVQAQDGDVIFDGTTWQDAGSDTPEMLGINTAADATNRLAVAAPASLLTHEGASHQVKINKATPGDTNALLFQTNWSGRAEMGCVGSDDFSIKVSEDGTTFHEGMVVDAASGAVTFPNGVAGTGSAAGLMGGQTVAFCGERNSSVNVGQSLSFGNGATEVSGPVMPFGGKIVAITLSISGGSAGVTAYELYVDETADPAFAVSVDYSGSGGPETAVADFAAAPRTVSAGSAISLICAQTAGAQRLVGTFYVVFD